MDNQPGIARIDKAVGEQNSAVVQNPARLALVELGGAGHPRFLRRRGITVLPVQEPNSHCYDEDAYTRECDSCATAIGRLARAETIADVKRRDVPHAME